MQQLRPRMCTCTRQMAQACVCACVCVCVCVCVAVAVAAEIVRAKHYLGTNLSNEKLCT
jgi:hypothetical protein